MILILACVAAVGKFIVIGEQGEFCFTLFLFVLLSLPLSSTLSLVSILPSYPSLSLSFHLSLSSPLPSSSLHSLFSFSRPTLSLRNQWLKTKQAGKLQLHSVYSIVNTLSIAKVVLERTLISSGHKWIWLLTEHVTLAYWNANVQNETEWT